VPLPVLPILLIDKLPVSGSSAALPPKRPFVVLAKLPKVFATPYNWLPLIASVDCAFTRPAATFVIVRFSVSLPTLSVESAEPPA